ncbi:peptidoglycan editing factor PgeF [Nocardiopsis sp. MG754419]|uniref:peptidoglycan editing factor PgeF n=1 Tax=Nocardiopsis sp. MG754419 TaxID=2259865 RepID=UPI001BAA6BCA|nr:peptidoglycan editing factor PgeF [Nocardiopsis sp. MG754419]MBR8745320.1 peptidoglycan editing factor PgeF [Nocardiopsis sp. MG754419]
MGNVIDLGHDVRAAVTERKGGVSSAPFDSLNLGLGTGDVREAVLDNRRRAAEDLGFDIDRVVWMNQVHSADVLVATAPGGVGTCDGVVTTRPDLVLASMAADCLPVLAADAEAGVLGAAHSGRLGTANAIAVNLVETMVAQGARTDHLTVFLGPTICGSCYEVPPELQEQTAERTPEAASTTRRGTTGVDMLTAVTAQLRRAGVENITHDGRCTLESPELFSHRRGAPTGRFASFLWRTGPATPGRTT